MNATANAGQLAVPIKYSNAKHPAAVVAPMPVIARRPRLIVATANAGRAHLVRYSNVKFPVVPAAPTIKIVRPIHQTVVIRLVGRNAAPLKSSSAMKL